MTTERDVKTLLTLLSAERLPGDPVVWPPAKRQAATSIMWNDLKTRAMKVAAADGPAAALREILAWSAAPVTALPSPPAAASKVSVASKVTVASDRPDPASVDVLLICPLAKELYAALVPFGIDPNADEWRNIDGHKIFLCEVARGSRRSIVVAISVVTKPRNIPTALATSQLIAALRPSTVLLCGIGGGVKTKTNLGDVVVATAIRDVAGGRDQPTGKLLRDETFNIPTPTDRQLNYFCDSPNTNATWKAQAREVFEDLSSHAGFILPTPEDMARAALQLTSGIVVAGETLVADGSLPSLLEDRDDRIRSCDMEGSGFAQASRGLEWAVFRGVSDFGDPDKTNEWQAVAAANAALAAHLFLASQFRLRSEMTNTGF